MNIALSQSPVNTIFYHGDLPYAKVIDMYKNCDIFVFASSCETFGISLLEAMSAGMPIACSNRPPLPEMLADCGVYFNPEDVDSIKSSLKLILQNSSLRKTLGFRAFSQSKLFDWQFTADATFSFLKSSIGK
jgi:glycosyltransferase involved in cell wall biosynthesis